MWSLKNDINELIYKTETLKDLENKFMIPKGREVGLTYTCILYANQQGPTN